MFYFNLFFYILFQNLIKKFMAFVFRSQKQSLFNLKKQSISSSPSSSLSNQQSQLNGASYTNTPNNNSSNSPNKILKGLPSLLKKDKSPKNQPFQFEKQNQVLYQTKPQKFKVNLHKLKKINQNYFFASNVIRDSNCPITKQLNKNQTCSQFKTSFNQQISPFDYKKPFQTNYMKQKFVVNKNLVNTVRQNFRDLRNTLTQHDPKNNQQKNLIIDYSKQKDSEIKRKCSPPITSNSFLNKNKLNNTVSSSKLPLRQTQINMQSSVQTIKRPLQKCQTEKKLMKLHKGNLQTSFYKQDSDQSEQQQIEEEHQTPGPGAYSNIANLKEKKSFRSRKQKFAKIFVSPLQRFKTEQVKYHQITYVNQGKPQKIVKNQGFLSRSPKFLSLQKKSSSPEPGTYNPRLTLQHDIVRNLLRNANTVSFNSTLPRFNYQKLRTTPGPGQYNVDSLQNARLQEIRNQMSFCYKSQVKRCLDYGQNSILKNQQQLRQGIQALTDQQYQKSVIHKRQQYFNTQQFFSPPAFLSSVQRFPQMNVQNGTFCSLSRLQQKKLLKQTKCIQPFNSSEKRKFCDEVGQGVGVGSYLVQKDRWNKKSYNVHFH